MAEENPFSKYVKQAEENPFSKYVRSAEPQPDAVPPQDPTEQLFVSREAIDPQAKRVENLPKYYGEMIPMAADAATFGLGNRAVAHIRAVLGEGSWGDNYNKHIASQNAYLKQLRDADPDRAVMSELLGGVGSGAGLARAGITLAKPGVGWISRAVRGGAEGALQGAAQGAGQSYGTLGEKALAAGTGAAMGGTFGTGIPLAVSGTAVPKTLFDMYKGNVPKYPPSMLRAAEADRAALEVLPQKMGPEGMLVDTPSMRRVAAGAMTVPGPGATKMETNLLARERETPLRLREGLDTKFGPTPVPKHIEAEVERAAREIGPEWDKAFNNAKAVDADKVALWLEGQIGNLKDEARTHLERVRKNLNVHGTDVLDPHPRSLHQTRRAIGAVLEDRQQNLDSVTKGALKQAYGKISEELHDKVPGMANLDARTAEIRSRWDAFKRGRDVLDTGKEQYTMPVEWAEEKAAMALPKGGPRATTPGPSLAPKFSEQGTRWEVGRQVNTGTDNLRKLETTFAPYADAAEKLKIQFGVKNTEEFQELLRNNREFRDSYQQIIRGSQTANKTEAVADSVAPYENLLTYATKPVQLIGEALDQAQAGYKASILNRITGLLATRGDDPTFDTLRKDMLNAAAEQRRKDITRSILETGARLGVTSEVPRATRRQ